ncbi:hypothetical protein CROQUDRAFT_90200 [Cronartium quercuum f. sp. fusiforme G11]|uniref:Uncharacterized protein n=1 Tax=Cronartium quercuum f. sp. fusiforme G11 TaxID=708437 RepID=A0A9P6NQJ4_9BASI|nr:hypothetical protein CROQUDRAFT_90200 [Cronartium quercuum f. sp. fusiforme G11]
MAQRLALGTLQSHPLIYSKRDTNLPSTPTRLNCKFNQEPARMLSLALTNPAGPASHALLGSRTRSYRPVLSTLLHIEEFVSGILITCLEIIDPAHLLPAKLAWLSSRVEPSKEKALRLFLCSPLPNPLAPQSYFYVMAPERLETPETFTHSKPPTTIYILINCKTSIREAISIPPASTGRSLCLALFRDLMTLHEQVPNAKVTDLPDHLKLPAELLTIKAQIKSDHRDLLKTTPSSLILARLRGQYNRAESSSPLA